MEMDFEKLFADPIKVMIAGKEVLIPRMATQNAPPVATSKYPT
jgi:hypothetical protein